MFIIGEHCVTLEVTLDKAWVWPDYVHIQWAANEAILHLFI